MKQQGSSKSGISLMEMLIVLSVLSIFSFGSFSLYRSVQAKIQKYDMLATVAKVALGIERYRVHYGDVPSHFPQDVWVNLQNGSLLTLMCALSGEVNEQNPEGVCFCEFTQSELSRETEEQSYFDRPVWIFIRNQVPLDIVQRMLRKRFRTDQKLVFYFMDGNRILYCIP